MKQLKLFSTFAFILLILASCRPTPAVPEEPVSLTVSPAGLTFTSDVSTQTIEIKSNTKWYLDASELWCQTSVTSGSGHGSVNVTVSANTQETARTAVITFTAQGAEKQTVTITQEALTSQTMEVAPDPWDGSKRADITYQLLIYSFADSDGDGIGDFQGIRSKLDYLDQLGVSALWLSPAHPAGSYHGYDVMDYEALNPQYGTEADFKALIDDAHSHGIRIYMDYVINHTSVRHPWFQSAVASEDSEYRDWYIFSENPAGDIAAGRIPMIATEGAAGYDSGQWYSATTGGSQAMNVRFTLSCSSAGAPQTLTIEQVEKVENNGKQNSGKYLWWGDPGRNTEFYSDGSGVYTLSLALDSPWGVLVRTSASSWDGNTKYGAPSSARQLEWGKPLKLSSSDPQDILLPGQKALAYHSHFWTSSFADLNFGPVQSCADSPAFKAVVSAARKWIDLGVDGFRLDGAKHVYHNASSDENPVFWKTFYSTLNDYFRRTHSSDIYMVGEVYDGYQVVAPYYQGFPALFEFDFWNRLEWALNNGTGCYFAKDILSYQKLYAQYRSDYREATKLTNHDEHRAGSLLGGDKAKMKMAGAILLTAAGEPYIYYGEELGYVGRKDGGDEYVRSAMRWGDSHTTSFIKQIYAGLNSVSSAKDQAGDGDSVLSAYRTFAVLRNTYPALAEGQMSRHPVYNEDNTQYRQVAAWYMAKGSQKMLVIHNLSSKPTTVNITDRVDKAVATLGTVSGTASGSSLGIRLDAWSSVVLLLK